MRNKINALLMDRTHNMSTQFLRFLLAGGLVVLLDTGIFYVLSVPVGMHYLVANVLSIVIASVANFVVNDHWTFGRLRMLIQRWRQRSHTSQHDQ